MTICLGKRCSFGLLCMSSIWVHQFVSGCEYACFPFGLEGGLCSLIVLVPDHCLSF